MAAAPVGLFVADGGMLNVSAKNLRNAVFRLSFDRQRSQFDLDRVAMLSHHFIDLRVRNDVNSNRRHCSMGYLRVHFPIDKSDSIPAQKGALWTLQN